MNKYIISCKIEFDAWFETLGPHFAGEYKKYFDEWNAGVKVKRAEEQDLRTEARFSWDRLNQDQEQADRKAKKLSEKDLAFTPIEFNAIANNEALTFSPVEINASNSLLSGLSPKLFARLINLLVSPLIADTTTIT